jgi:aspartate/tyrosine/aromatic aminotransferase
MLEHLIPSRRTPPGEEPIFALNAEAVRRRAAGEDVLNATLGALADDQGALVVHECVMELWRELSPQEIAPYAPLTGDPAFLKALVQRHWPRLESPGCACATPGGSGALSLSVRTFLEPGMALLTGAPYWGPYDLLTGENGVRIAAAPFKVAGHSLDLETWGHHAKALMGRQGRLLVWLNDPCQNPTGLSLSGEDRQGLLEILRDQADRGPVVVVVDAAYVDYTTDPGHVRDALDQYAEFGAEGRILVGAALSISKSLTLYGARGGALAFPWCKDSTLTSTLGLACRGLWSAAPKAPQSLLARLARDGKRLERLHAEHRHWSQVLESRAIALDTALRAEGLDGAPWHGGFFATLRLEAPAAVAERLKRQGVFVVPVGEGLRVGICGLRAADAPRFAAALRNAV